MTDSSHDLDGDPHDLLAGYLLDVLDPEEADRFTRHVPSCPSCRSDLLTLSATVAELASASHVVPPAHIEDQLMASLFRPISSAGRRRWMLPAAAAAAFVLGAGILTATGALHIGDTGSQVVADGEAQLILNVTGAPDAHFMPLDVPQGSAKLVISRAMNMGAVMATDMPMPASGREYHVWTVMGDGTMVSAATFTPDGDGHVSTMLHTGVDDAAAFMLTVEEPGAEHPTGDPLAEVRT